MKNTFCFAAALVAAFVFTVPYASAAQVGAASWYALDGRTTANGERMNSRRMTAAHRKLPFGARVRVKNLRNGRSVVVRINDRGPYAKGRIIDLSKAAARKLGFIHSGHTRVSITRLRRRSALEPQQQAETLSRLARITVPTPRPVIKVASLVMSGVR